MGRLIRLSFGLGVGILLSAGIGVPSACGQNSSSLSKKADPSGTGPMMNQLRALFAKWDGNGDLALDKEELAKGFRGPDAKPLAPPVRARGKESASRPDYEFLIAVDLNGDGLVSRDEYLNWAREYAVLQKNIRSSETKVIKAETKVLTYTTASARARAEIELRTERLALQRLLAQLPPYEKQLQQILKPPQALKKGK